MRIWRAIMIILVVWTGLSAASPSQSVNINQPKPSDRWLAMDKLKHFSTSFYLTTTVFYGQNRVFEVKSDRANFKAAGLTITLGALKELRDWRQKENYFSWRDLVADALGAGTAFLLLSRIK